MQATDITLLWQMENAGFAGACNLGLRYLGLESCDWFLLLNNDTIVRHDFLEQMLAQAEHAPQIEVWAPVITYFHNPNLIWDVGGDLTWWGDRTFPGRKKLRSKYPTRGFTQRSFLTGCALLVKSSLFRELGLLTEQFFFGEEDYWFARHLQQHRRQLAVCWAAEIRHKVATSIRKVSPNSSIPLVYIHNLNRLIDMRTWLKPPCYLLWELVYLPYACFRLWWKNWVPLPVLLRFIRLLLETTRYKTEVTRTDFFQARKRFK